ncbi:hypothetical protein CALCODRAFT_316687 [Calocera cornea HHB12733]|uniref:Uncharacterized protein n=1 Tax=Calocera cornea HHB12733 TaxID=1353952 RepID=A0A165F8D3_9BASI|nr:hypothetical protein CALCODRAFT_316687 [Calocera cornea HHB12733]
MQSKMDTCRTFMFAGIACTARAGTCEGEVSHSFGIGNTVPEPESVRPGLQANGASCADRVLSMLRRRMQLGDQAGCIQQINEAGGLRVALMPSISHSSAVQRIRSRRATFQAIHAADFHVVPISLYYQLSGFPRTYP